MTKMTMQNKSRFLLLVFFVLFFCTFLIGNVFGWFGSITYIYEPLDVRFPENGVAVAKSGDQTIDILNTNNITNKEFKFLVGHYHGIGPDNIAYTVGFQFEDNYVNIKDNATFSATLTRQKLVETVPTGAVETLFSNKDFTYLETYISDLTVLPRYTVDVTERIEYRYTLAYSLTGIGQNAVGSQMVLNPRVAAFYENEASLATGGGSVNVGTVANIDSYLAAKKNGSILNLTADISYPKTLFVTDFANNTAVKLNNYNLTVDGDLIFEYGGATDSFLDLTGGGILTVNGDLIIKMPYAKFRLEGNYLTSSYAQLKVNGKIYVDVAKPVSNLAYNLKHSAAGLYVKNIHMISLQKEAEYLGADLIIAGGSSGAGSRVFIDKSSFVGLVASEKQMFHGGTPISYVSNVEVINYGQIGYIDFKQVNLNYAFADHLIEIYNDGEIFGRYTTGDETKYHVTIPNTATYSTFDANREVLTQGNTYMEVGLNSNLYRTNYRKGVEFYARKILVDNESIADTSFQTQHVLQIYSTVHFIYWDEFGVEQTSTAVVNYAERINPTYIPKEGATWYSRTWDSASSSYISTPLDGLVDLNTFVISSDIYLYEIIAFTINYELADKDKAGFSFSAPNFSSNNQIYFDAGDVYAGFDGISFAEPSKENYRFEGWAFASNLAYNPSNFIPYDNTKQGYFVSTSDILSHGSWDSRTGTYALSLYSYWDPYVIRLIRNDEIIGSYNTFAEPYNAAQAGDRIELLNDYHLLADFTIDKNITFDLGAYQLALGSGVDLIVKQGYVLGNDDCFTTSYENTTIEIYAAADASKIGSYINGIEKQSFYRTETTKYIAKDIDPSANVDISWCEYFTINLYKPWLVQSPTDLPEATFSTYYSASITSNLAVYETGGATCWVPLATIFSEWQDNLGNRVPPERLSYLTRDMDLYFKVNAMAAISLNGTSNGTTKTETMVLKNTVDFTIAAADAPLNIQNTVFSATLGGNAWKSNSDFNATTKRLSLVSDTTEGIGIVTVTYNLIDPQTSAAISINGQSSVQGTWTALVRYPEVTYRISDPEFGGKWQWEVGTAAIGVYQGKPGYSIDSATDLPEIFAADFYHYLDNQRYSEFDLYKTQDSTRDYYDFRNQKLLTGHIHGNPTYGLKGLLYRESGAYTSDKDIQVASGAIFSRRNSTGAVIPWSVLDSEVYHTQWAATSTTSATDGYANFLFQNINSTNVNTMEYTISGGFLGTEPYKTKYKGLVDLMVALYWAKYRNGDYGLGKWTSAINNGTDPSVNRWIRRIFAWNIEAYFFNLQTLDNINGEQTTNVYNRTKLIRDIRRTIPNTNVEYTFTGNETTGWTINQVFSSVYPTGDYTQRGGPGVKTLGYHTNSAAFMYDLITGYSSTVNNATPIKTSAGGNTLYSFIGWSTVAPVSGYSFSNVPRHASDPGKLCSVCDGYVNGNFPETITADDDLYPIYKLSSRVGEKIWER